MGSSADDGCLEMFMTQHVVARRLHYSRRSDRLDPSSSPHGIVIISPLAWPRASSRRLLLPRRRPRAPVRLPLASLLSAASASTTCASSLPSDNPGAPARGAHRLERDPLRDAAHRRGDASRPPRRARLSVRTIGSRPTTPGRSRAPRTRAGRSRARRRCPRRRRAGEARVWAENRRARLLGEELRRQRQGFSRRASRRPHRSDRRSPRRTRARGASAQLHERRRALQRRPERLPRLALRPRPWRGTRAAAPRDTSPARAPGRAPPRSRART